MLNHESIVNGIEKDIECILFDYIKAKSFSNTIREKEAESFFIKYFSNMQYFKENQELYGLFAIENDSLKRNVCYALLKGKGDNTIVFVHHNDIVSVEDFKLLKDFAFSPIQLKEELLKIKETLTDEVQIDLNEDTFLFGRGICDMKGGGAIQIALLKRYSELKDFNGNIVLIAVPDEENLSSGMRAAVRLLDELKSKYNLNYRLMINSEPHQRKNFKEGIFSEGSVGKLMPFIYVRGVLAHAGKVFEGFNPLNLMSCIVRKTELNMELSDFVGNEAAPPPTWLYLKDGKIHYDVSMPLSVKGCFSILTLNQTPQSILEKVRKICIDAFDETIFDINKNYVKFLKATELSISVLPWTTKVVNFEELYSEAKASYGNKFLKEYEKKYDELLSELKNNKISVIDSNFDLIDFIYGYIDDISPRIVYGLIPPYYPNVSNLYFENLDSDVKGLSNELNKFTEKEFNQTYKTEYFYTGISDLSYTSIKNSAEIINALNSSMPLLGEFYNIPIETIENISMPCINIGPWGKDFHKLTERVFIEDLYINTPRIINYAVSTILKN